MKALPQAEPIIPVGTLTLNDHPVRVLTVDPVNEFANLVAADDVAKALGYSDSTHLLRHHRDTVPNRHTPKREGDVQVGSGPSTEHTPPGLAGEDLEGPRLQVIGADGRPREMATITMGVMVWLAARQPGGKGAVPFLTMLSGLAKARQAAPVQVDVEAVLATMMQAVDARLVALESRPAGITAEESQKIAEEEVARQVAQGHLAGLQRVIEKMPRKDRRALLRAFAQSAKGQLMHDRIYQAVVEAQKADPEKGLLRSRIHDLFNHNETADDIGAVLEFMCDEGEIEAFSPPRRGPGRPAICYRVPAPKGNQ